MTAFFLSLCVFGLLYIVCIMRSHKSRKAIAEQVRRLLYIGLLPLLANVFIVLSGSRMVCEIAYTIYCVGTDVMLYFLVTFSMTYCSYDFSHRAVKYSLRIPIVLDIVSILLNPFFGHFFDLQLIGLENGLLYYSLVSLPFHKVHLLMSALYLALVFGIFIHKIFTVSQFHLERYLVILLTLIATALWEGFYILSNTPIDLSMIGYAVCGILIYYFSLEYLPIILTERMLASVVSNISDAIFFIDDHGECIYFNKSAASLLHLADRAFDEAKKRLERLLPKETFIGTEGATEIKTFVVDKAEYSYKIERQQLFDKHHIYAGSFVSIQDRTVEELQKKKELYFSHHDSLTGLYNKEYFFHRVEQQLADDPDTDYMVIGSNVKEFKIVNDIFGRKTGNQMLIDIAEKIEQHVGDFAIYGRIESDKYGMLIRKKYFDEKLFLNASSGFVHKEGDVIYPITIHIGVYELREKDIPVSVMFGRAFMAIEGIRNDMQKRIAYYDEQMRAAILWEQQVSASLDEAIIMRQFVPYLQAQVNADGVVEGAEVLVRWQHPTEGLMAPSRFIPVLEKTGLIVKLDQYMWEAACSILQKWKVEGRDNLYLSVNISPKDFYFCDVYDVITRLIKKYDIDPSRLRLEITESVIMNDLDRKLSIINRLRARGFIFEMDDFGSGYSSLNLLKDLPVDVIKLDMVFLRQTNNASRARTIIQFLVSMVNQLKLSVITEGVETLEQVDFLIGVGCRLFQGYYFSKPVTLASFESLST